MKVAIFYLSASCGTCELHSWCILLIELPFDNSSFSDCTFHSWAIASPSSSDDDWWQATMGVACYAVMILDFTWPSVVLIRISVLILKLLTRPSQLSGKKKLETRFIPHYNSLPSTPHLLAFCPSDGDTLHSVFVMVVQSLEQRPEQTPK